jgi:S-methylmethionine-dependent homocysteine/selenocysteine methylase
LLIQKGMDMSRSSQRATLLAGRPFLTDGGLETTLIFREGIALRHFAAFDLLKDASGRAVLERYFSTYAEMAREHRIGCILESATWRASADWGTRLGYSTQALAAANRAAIELLVPIARRYETATTPILISGCVGPRGDGYRVGERLTALEAQRYHAPQIQAFSETEADLVTAITMTSVDEALGIVRAASEVGIPSVVSFTVETDGKLPSGQDLAEAIERVDAESPAPPAYYMINCAHPLHFAGVLERGGRLCQRIHGLRVNASTKSHAELDESTLLDDGDPEDLGRHYRRLCAVLPNLNVLGGCCGTDHRHVDEMCRACTPLLAQRQRGETA